MTTSIPPFSAYFRAFCHGLINTFRAHRSVSHTEEGGGDFRVLWLGCTCGATFFGEKTI